MLFYYNTKPSWLRLTGFLFDAIIYIYRHKQEREMGFKILPKQDMQGYGPIPKLEGPFNFNGWILYYDPKEGKYWDPKTDFYVPHDEYFRMVGLI